MKDIYFKLGALCFMVSNVPALYQAIVNGIKAPISFLILLQMGITFYLVDAIKEKRPTSFVLVGLFNFVCNLTVILI